MDANNGAAVAVDTAADNDGYETNSESPKPPREPRPCVPVQPEEGPSEHTRACGPEALPFLRSIIPELSNLPSTLK